MRQLTLYDGTAGPVNQATVYEEATNLLPPHEEYPSSPKETGNGSADQESSNGIGLPMLSRHNQNRNIGLELTACGVEDINKHTLGDDKSCYRRECCVDVVTTQRDSHEAPAA